ncbi:MAG: hypothetical protein GYB66_08870 [Chloroflexi bacterium]|nr:hypothetical protein [Chloroflexota bacterium]
MLDDRSDTHQDHEPTFVSEVVDEQVDFVTPQEAEDILRPEVERLVEEGWQLINKPLYGARLQRENEIIDLRVDLRGKLETETKLAFMSPAQRGRLIAWVLLLSSLLVTLTLASVLGFLD